jgi:hypothetical protein
MVKCFEQFAPHRKVDSVANRVIKRDRGDLAFNVGTNKFHELLLTVVP